MPTDEPVPAARYLRDEEEAEQFSSTCGCDSCHNEWMFRQEYYARSRWNVNPNLLRAFEYAERVANRIIRTPGTPIAWRNEYQVAHGRYMQAVERGLPPPTEPIGDPAPDPNAVSEAVPEPDPPTTTTINFAVGNLGKQIYQYDQQERTAKTAILAAAQQLKSSRVALRELRPQLERAEKLTITSDDLIRMKADFPELIEVYVGPCRTPGGRLPPDQIELLFLPVVFAPRKRLTSPLSFVLDETGRVMAGSRTNIHPHLQEGNICLGGMTASNGSYSSVESILHSLASVNDLGGIIGCLSAWRMGNQYNDELDSSWLVNTPQAIFDPEICARWWPEWDGVTVQHADRGTIASVDRYLPGVFENEELTRKEVGRLLSTLLRDQGRRRPWLDRYTIEQVAQAEVGTCSRCFHRSAKVAWRSLTPQSAVCTICGYGPFSCACPVNMAVVPLDLVHYYPSTDVAWMPTFSNDEPFERWCAARGRIAGVECGHGAGIDAPWLRVQVTLGADGRASAITPLISSSSTCYNHAVGQISEERRLITR